MEWSTWNRLHKMRPVDALAFLSTAVCAVFFNAVLAVALGCSRPMRSPWLFSQPRGDFRAKFWARTPGV